ncbi:Basic helix-loop-helix (BHLH) DNA-binding superfamily [Rhynchospora pubera]|uniref:Basic helix-loop-helix (BHLH) DNA-binding superfamily n=1 Tax=Rhynchospora pubera TaxID=906938 RepID=A0AAV8H8I5_9POAL|nr:Basic helix-loop-helix (BHLH) DNA-binding superfamily [Rhynchospora pubera]
MTLETLASNDLPNFLIYDTINATQALQTNYPSNTCILLGNAELEASPASLVCVPPANTMMAGSTTAAVAPTAVQSRRKRRRRVRTCKNKEDAESQRMTHIAVERNRRRQMNEYLAVLRSLMPDSYIQRGDQASIVGGAIDFVKELEQLLQSLEAQKRALVQKQKTTNPTIDPNNNGSKLDIESPPFAQFFSYPQYIWCHAPRDCPVPAEHQQSAIADIEVTLIETHANIRIMSPRRPGQLLKMVAGLQTLRLTILHLNVTAMDAMALYSLSVKVEEGCNLTTVDDIAAAVHHILSLIEAEMVALNP